MTQEQEMRAQVDAAYEAAMREAEGLRRAYEQHALRLIFLIRLSAGIATVIVAGLLFLLVNGV